MSTLLFFQIIDLVDQVYLVHDTKLTSTLGKLETSSKIERGLPINRSIN